MPFKTSSHEATLRPIEVMLLAIKAWAVNDLKLTEAAAEALDLRVREVIDAQERKRAPAHSPSIF